MVKSKLSDLSPEQAERLVAFANANGANWRADLTLMWMLGTDALLPDGHLLRQIRNQRGPKWLAALPRTEIEEYRA